MTYRTKLLLDRFFGPPFSFLVNILALLTGALLKRDHSFKDLNNKYIVICKIVGLGSIVEFSYSLKALKEKYPEAKLIFITSSSNKELIQLLMPFISHALYINDQHLFTLFTSSIKTVTYLARRKVDTFINLEVYSYYTTFLSILSFARNRYGYYRKSVAFRKGIDTHLIYFNTKRGIREIYEQSAKALGVDGIEYDLKFPFAISNNSIVNVDLFFKQNQIQKYIIINTNASDLMPERRWDKENWKLVIEYLLKSTDYAILLSGSNTEKDNIDFNFSKQFSENATKLFNVAGKLNLSEFIYCLQKAVLLISNDSGPLHLAYSQHTASISLWGPTDPTHLSVKSENNIEICKNVYCSPCLHHTDVPPCKGNNICMKSITVEEVIQKIDLLLKMQIE